jgi:Cu/Ag efflux pump CusA
VPLSITRALLALKLTAATMNVYSQIGLVTLVGLITKHGILIVEFGNQLQVGLRLPEDEEEGVPLTRGQAFKRKLAEIWSSVAGV